MSSDSSTNDLSDLASVQSDCTCHSDDSFVVVKDLQGTVQKLTEELEQLRTGTGSEVAGEMRKKSNNELEATIQKLTEENEKLRGEAGAGAKDVEDILTSINGSWRIVSSTGVKEYLANHREDDRNGIWGACFETGLANFSYDEKDQKLTSFFSIGSQVHSKKTAKIGEKCVVNNFKQIVFVEDNSLITIGFYRDTPEECWRQKRFVKDGRLHFVTKRFGMKCTRVYEKVEKWEQEQCDVKVLRKRVGELEEEMVQQKEELVKLHEQQKLELVRELEEDQAEILRLNNLIKDLKNENEMVQQKEGLVKFHEQQLRELEAARRKTEYSERLLRESQARKSCQDQAEILRLNNLIKDLNSENAKITQQQKENSSVFHNLALELADIKLNGQKTFAEEIIGDWKCDSSVQLDYPRVSFKIDGGKLVERHDNGKTIEYNEPIYSHFYNSNITILQNPGEYPNERSILTEKCAYSYTFDTGNRSKITGMKFILNGKLFIVSTGDERRFIQKYSKI